MKKTLSFDDFPPTAGLSKVWCHHLVPHIAFTEGVKYVADEADAHWLLDTVALAQNDLPPGTVEVFQVWTLCVAPDHSATLTGVEGLRRTVFEKTIEYTDFPLPEIWFWVLDGVILLPWEL